MHISTDIRHLDKVARMQGSSFSRLLGNLIALPGKDGDDGDEDENDAVDEEQEGK